MRTRSLVINAFIAIDSKRKKSGIEGNTGRLGRVYERILNSAFGVYTYYIRRKKIDLVLKSLKVNNAMKSDVWYDISNYLEWRNNLIRNSVKNGIRFTK